MAKQLRPQQELFFQFISCKQAGSVVTEAEILAATKWKQATIDAYRIKNMLDPFLGPTGPGKYRVLRDGSTVSKGEVAAAFTQKRPGVLVLSKGMKAKGDQGSYELQTYIGQGAVAHVWVARAPDGRKLAIKVMNPREDLLEPNILENVRQRFSRESRHGMTISHENIVTYRDVGELSKHPFLVMDLADESLEARLAKNPLNLRDSLDVMAGCVAGLKHLHGLECVHRDVKPANILRFGDRYALGDLGIVQWSDLNKAFVSAGTITRASVQLGSWHYMPPEQRRLPHKVTSAVDIYALGITWYEMLTGNTPDPGEVGAQAFDDPTENPPTNDLIRRMLRYAAGERPTAEDVESVLSNTRSQFS